MKKSVICIIAVILLICSFGVICVFANDDLSTDKTQNESSFGFEYYENENGELYISGFSGDVIPDTVVIPSEIDGKKVTGINKCEILENGDGKFVPVDLRGIKHLELEEGIVKISCMFVGTENLETVTLPTSLKSIASFAFAGAEKLKSINLENVIAVSSFAFQGCKSLTEVNLASAEKVGLYSFDKIDNLKMYAKRLSAAENYAKENKIYYERLPEDPTGKMEFSFDGNIYYGLEGTAMALYKLGLMKGENTDENGKIVFGLLRTPTRVEAVTMLVRLLGAEEEAVNMKKTHPFSDVPEWADGYVSYAYENGYTKGVSDTLFDSYSVAAPEMYLTFVLRALGYTDSGSDPDFSWENPWEFAGERGITERRGYYEIFLRNEMVDMSYYALFAEIKGTGKKLYEKMLDEGVFTKSMFDQMRDLLEE